MKESLKGGLSFGLTSGVITTMGLMVGLYAGTRSFKAVIGGVLTIAIADALSDALGMHIHEESENAHTPREIWESTLATFVSKFVFSLIFILPLFLFSLGVAMLINVVWGIGLVALLSYRLAKAQGTKPAKIITEHVIIASVVVIVTHLAGRWIYSLIY